MKCRDRYSCSPRQRAFTLVEVVIAIGIVTAVMIPMVILLGYGIDNAADITARDRALRLVPAIEERLNSADSSEVLTWGQSGGRLYAYVYRASSASGTATGEPGSATTGKDVFVAIARSSRESGKIASEVASLEGHMFRVDLKPVKLPIDGAAKPGGTRTPRSGQNAPFIELEADIARILSPPVWQSSEIAPRIVLRFVLNR